MLNNIGLPGFLFLAFIVYVLFLIMKPKRRSESDNPPPVRQEPVPKMQVPRTVQDYTPPQPKTEPEAEPIPPIIGKCHVVDGDTIHIGSKKIRFAGMNAPELDEPYGKQAKWALVELCKGQEITAYPTGETSYERIVAKCYLPDGRDLAAEMIKLELALDIPHFPNADYKHLETPAARRKLSWKPRKKKKSDKSN